MKTLTFYEQVGIVIPGGMLLFGLMFYFPELRSSIMTKEGIGIGSLGVFLIVAYAAGNALGAVGHLMGTAYWHVAGGMPSNWVIGETPRVLSAAQIPLLEERVRQRLQLMIPPLKDMKEREWLPISREIYSDVQKYGKPERVDTFNGNYGLNRGLFAGMLALAAVGLIVDANHWYISVVFAGSAIVYFYHMQRFGQHYARELFNQFLLLPPEPGKPKKPPKHKAA